MFLPLTLALVHASIPLQAAPDDPTSGAAAQAHPALAIPGLPPVPGIRVGLWWEDFDVDGWPDAFSIAANGTARLLRNHGDGSFTDVTLIAGLDPSKTSTFASWHDFDRDGAPDLFVGAAAGPGRLLRNAGDGTFQDVTEFVGLSHTQSVLAVQWLDYDLDGLSDFAMRTEASEELFHALPSGRFEPVDLGLTRQAGRVLAGTDDLPGSEAAEHDPALQRRARATGALPGFPAPATTSNGSGWSGAGSPGGSTLNMITCVDVIKDQANANCIVVSSTPTMGALYPLTANLNVSLSGNVGIGTTNPATRLDVSGDVRASGQLVSSAISGAPLVVASTTMVTNLNADLLDGLDSIAFTQLGQTIEGGEIAASTITSTNLATGAVTSVKIADATITTADVALDTLTAQDIATGGVGSAEILDAAVTANDLATDAVTTVEIKDGTIAAGDLAVGSVTTGVILDGTIGNADLAPDAVTGANIAPGSIGASEIANLAITGAQVAGGSIDSNKFTAPMTFATTLSLGGSSYASLLENTSTSGIRDGLRVEVSSSSAYGVWSQNLALTGSAYAVRAESNSTTARACFGVATSTSTATVSHGVYGAANSTAGFGVFSSGDFGGTGAKYFIQPHPTDASKQVNFACLEGNESGTYFRGSIQLAGGRAVVKVPESFRLVTEPDSVTATATAVGVPALVWVESQSLEQVVVRANVDAVVNYVVLGTRRGFRGLESIRENTSFVPEYRGLPFGLQYRPEYRRLLVENGVLNADFTPNEATALRLGWQLLDPWEDEHAEPTVRELIRAGLVAAPIGWVPPSMRAAPGTAGR